VHIIVLGRVLSLEKQTDGQIAFHEECDGHYSVTMPKEEAKQEVLEALLAATGLGEYINKAIQDHEIQLHNNGDD